ncbi:poly [ADP-ribose] polymerase tankyrase-1-like isoform X2 [Macrobrachium nipponense]|uniref:poly [ADP-ribose] polymerase tankyrase-1-like isoform X2 n=1 Tax=Macrobrachium nipponense TaxID=159736 RepID=UPI0030C7EC85
METLISLMQMGSMDSSNMMDITDAALKGDLKRLYQLAKEGTQALSGVRDNAYQYAILNNFSMITGMIQGIIRNGANVNARDDQGLTALHLAASGKHPISSEVVRALLNVGADPRAVDKKGNTPLHHAISLYDSAVPVMLLDESKKVSASSTKEFDEWARTFIGLQNQDFYTDIIPSLIRSGANVNSKNKQGETPIHLASLCGHPYASEVVRTLISFGADVNATDNNDDTPLHRTVGSFNEKVAKVLLESGANTGAVNNLGSTPLSYACTFDRTHNANITRLILKHGADTNARQYNGSFPLTYAALTEFSGVTKIDALVAHGANVKLKGTNGITALFSALCNNHEDAVEIVKALLRHGADVNDTLPDGKSMLHVAVTNKNTNVVEVLLKHGANVNAMESVGLRPLHELSGNTFSSVTGIARLLISKGACVDLPDLGGFTPLHTAASMGNRPLVKYLVEEAGADPALKNNRGFTPLKLASENGFQSVVEYLLPVTKVQGKLQK